ncbi:MAG: alpha/beta fold hydrolase [Burkholderiaceae bacterium]
MIARLTRLVLLLQLLLAAGIAIAVSSTWPGISHFATAILGIGFVILIRTGIAANNFRLAARFPSDPASPKLGWKAATRLFFGELCATLLTSSLTMPFRQLPARPTLFAGAGQPVLLIHGYGCNSGYWWNLGQRLRKANISFYAVNLEPVLGEIDAYLPQVHAAIDTLCAASRESSVSIVAHSMGGLVARAYLRAYGEARVATLITLGTPHGGTGLAKFGLGENSRQMRCPVPSGPGQANQWLASLNSCQNFPSIPIVSIYSRHDNIVAPQSSSHLYGAKNVAFCGVGHVALGADPAVLDAVMHEIATARVAVKRQ